MKFVLKLFFVATVALLLALPLALWLAVERAPRVTNVTDISSDDVGHAVRWVQQNDPRSAGLVGRRSFVASQHEVDVMLNRAARRYFKASTRVVLGPGSMVVQASVPVSVGPLRAWLNVDTALRESNGLPEVDRLTIGSLPVPAFLTGKLLAALLEHLNASDGSRLASDMARSVTFSQDRIKVVYEWSDHSRARLLAALLPKAEQDRVHAYSDRLVDLVAQADAGRPMSLAGLLPPMFELARQRSVNGDAARENRALLITLTFYANGLGLPAIIPAAKGWQRPRQMTVTLNGRADTPLHFLISAAIAAEAGSRLSDAIGLYKEIDDSRVGSGFSFNDLAADRAGTRFGQLAVSAPAKLQAALVQSRSERDFMPDVADLEESMAQVDFNRRFGGIGSPNYLRVMADIEQRIAARPIFSR